KMQSKILRECAKAGKTADRRNSQEYTAPDVSAANKIVNKVVAYLAPTASAAPPTYTDVASSSLAQNYAAFATDHFNRINNYRKANGRKALTRHNCADNIAQSWSKYMVGKNVISHNPNLANQMTSVCSPLYWLKI